MIYLTAMVTLIILATIGSGCYLIARPQSGLSTGRARQSVIINVILFVAGVIVLMIMGINDVLAQVAPHGVDPNKVSVGMGLSLIGVGLPTAAATIGAGMVTAAIETAVRRPKVEDFSRLRADTTHVKGWWANRVTRILLVFLFSTLGSAAGTYLAGFRIIDRLAS